MEIYSLVILKPCDPGDEFLPVGSTREVVLCLPLIVPLYMTLIKTGRFLRWMVKNKAVKTRSFKQHRPQYSKYFIKVLLKERDQTGKPNLLTIRTTQFVPNKFTKSFFSVAETQLRKSAMKHNFSVMIRWKAVRTN